MPEKICLVSCEILLFNRYHPFPTDLISTYNNPGLSTFFKRSFFSCLKSFDLFCSCCKMKFNDPSYVIKFLAFSEKSWNLGGIGREDVFFRLFSFHLKFWPKIEVLDAVQK